MKYTCQLPIKPQKFRESLAEQILNGEKTCTWRLFDDKDLSEGDVVYFVVWETDKKFEKVKLVDIKEKTFSELIDADREGHEKFSSEEVMYKTYSKYYNREVNKNTKFKIIKFKLI
ncbi:MAG: ASCH domain-containing protein [Candidatus Nanoarchaeia archaeon]